MILRAAAPARALAHTAGNLITLPTAELGFYS